MASALLQELAASSDPAAVALKQGPQLAALRETLRTQRLESSTARIEVERNNKTLLQQAHNPSVVAREKYSSFIHHRADVFAILCQLRDAFAYGEALLESELRTAPMDALFEQCQNWAKFNYGTSLPGRLNDLQVMGTQLATDGASVHDCSELRSIFEQVAAVYKTNASRWHREMSRRRNRAKNLDEFETDRTKLLTWCRQQVAALTNVTDPLHVQEFCASFYNNTPVMESNFLVLMEMSENLMPSPELEAELIELAEVWLGLETQAYEKLRSTLLDLHVKSGLEADARLWPDFADRFGQFLAEALRILNIPTDEESKAVAAPLKDTAKELQANADAHRLIVAHLSDFALREECLNEHYNAIHKQVFSRLTLLTQAFPGLYAYPRKAEYGDLMAELSEWVEAKSRGQAWKELLARVDRMKRIIEDNESTINSTPENRY